MTTRPFIPSFDAFERLIRQTREPVVLLEGSREVPEAVQQRMETLAAYLMKAFPALRARSGNAPGADQAWARGVNSVDPARLELILPVPRWRREAILPGNQALSLREALPEDAMAARDLTRAHYEWGNRRGPSAYDPLPEFRKPYLDRDALKVLGHADYRGKRRKATAALFYLNASRKGGGTAHTIRLCEAERVPYILAEDWMEWKV